MTSVNKPNLPAPSHYHPISGEPLWNEPTVRRLLADERRKTLTEAATLMENTGKRIAAADIRALIDKEPT